MSKFKKKLYPLITTLLMFHLIISSILVKVHIDKNHYAKLENNMVIKKLKNKGFTSRNEEMRVSLLIAADMKAERLRKEEEERIEAERLRKEEEERIEAERIAEEERLRLYKEVHKYKMIVTAYCSCTTCCSAGLNLTASGVTPYVGSCAAPTQFSFGSTVEIPELGLNLIIEDTGSAIIIDSQGYVHIDVYMTSHEAALQFGKVYTEGYIY